MALEARTLPVTPFRQNCTILSNQHGQAVVVDPGGESERIFQQVSQCDVEAILLTHGHLDHVGGAASLREKLTAHQGKAVPVIGPGQEDDFLLKTIDDQAAAFNLTGMENVVPDRYLVEGEVLHLLGHSIRVAHVPGHTPGHVVFLDEADHRAIVGDTLFRGTVGRTDFPYGDATQLITEIRKKLFCLPDDTVVLCGHGLPTTIGVERRTNPFFK
ncbi:MBL fold metallo-hydrolase [Saccharibacter sp. 17.LH.SD]|uniref:MBL fold metallo-hydrolase n=1 Tax=Saccharibacter sp. 17.LH.SD TaxID=2689393 RepID=UPI00136D22DB|nr:MBL fold metallo-hydrolase [Saccharibacter sp. 17.LH.SD]MXV43671.1 MBL fold metallo-hydrolase [Saccharibacter sp. 17.LH.SD]